MKEIKAYIRHEKAEDVVRALEEAGATWITAIKVDEMGAGADLKEAEYSIEYSEKVCPLRKIEVVCSDEDVGRLVEVLREKAWTSREGDGIILVSDLQYVTRIRMGESGEKALISGDDKQTKRQGGLEGNDDESKV